MEPVWIAIGSFALAVIVQIITAVWVLRGLEGSLISKIQVAKDDVEKHVKEVKESSSAALLAAIQARNLEMDIIKNAAGEIGHSLREKISQVELYVRDEFVSKPDFKSHIDLLRDQLSAIGNRIDTKFDNFEKKLNESSRRDV